MAKRTKSSRASKSRPTQPAEAQRPQCHFISNTHWDREWMYSMQRTRYGLVQLMDLVLDLFDKEKGFKHFHLDSQTVPLLDYLELRPEKEPVIKRLVKAGKLAIGPWFTLPDEFCISGESIIRNLLLGHSIAARFGGASKTGYSPFSWGQCSQMPQIYKGFGIDMMMFYRGVNTIVAPKAEFIWRGPDGSEIVASRLGRRPRYNVWYVLQRPAYWGYSLDELNRFEAGWADGHAPFRMASGEFALLDYQAAHPRYAYDNAVMPEASRMALREQDADWSTPHRFWSAGHDASYPDAREVRLVEDARAALRDEADVFWSTIKAFQDGVLASRRKDWPVVAGEMRHAFTKGSTSPLLGGIISARTYLKQDNHATEQLLTRLAEPLAVFAALLGAAYPRAFVDRAYRYLLENHAHDSIGGCGRDIVAQDMLDRSRQCREIATCVLESAVREIAGAIDLTGEGTEARRHAGTKGDQGLDRERGADTEHGEQGTGNREQGQITTHGGASPNDVALVVFNPSPFARSEVVRVTLDTPRDWPHRDIGIVDDAGNPVEFQPIGGPVVNEERVFNPNDVFNYLTMNRRELCIAAKDVPAMGYRTYRVRSRGGTLTRTISLRAGVCAMGNDALSVEINPNGTLDVCAKGLEWQLPQVGYFVDSGAAGNPWLHEPPACDAAFMTLHERPIVSCLHDGALECTYRVEIPWSLPESLSADGRARSDRRVPYTIVNLVTIRRGQPWIEVVTELENVARDHYLRVSVPAWIDDAVHSAQTPLDVVERPVDPPDPSRFDELPQAEQPTSGFVDLSARDGECGVALLVDGLRAYAITRDVHPVIELTLLRAYGMKFFVPEKHDHVQLSAGSQCPGKHRFRYAIYPHKGDWRTGTVWEAAERFTTPLIAAQIAPSRHGSQPTTRSFLEIEPNNLHVSAVKQSEDGTGWVVRVFNPGSERVDARVRLNGGFAPPAADMSPTQRVKDEFALPAGRGGRWAGVQRVTLEEQPQRPLKLGRDGWVELTLGPRQIGTLKFDPPRDRP